MEYLVAAALLTFIHLFPALTAILLILGFCAAVFVAAWHVGQMLWDMGGSVLWDTITGFFSAAWQSVKNLWSGPDTDIDPEIAPDLESDLESEVGSDLGSALDFDSLPDSDLGSDSGHDFDPPVVEGDADSASHIPVTP